MTNKKDIGSESTPGRQCMSLVSRMRFNIIVVKNALKLGNKYQFISAIYPAGKSNKAILIVHHTDVGPNQKTSRFQSWKLSKDDQKVIFI